MTQQERSRQAAVKIKNTIDTIYDNTREPMHGGFKRYGANVRHVATLLAKRKILVNEGSKMIPIWKWNSDMAPTDNLYKTIYADYTAYYSGRNKARRAANEAPLTQEEAEKPTIRKATIKDYSSQELWEELKSRGYQIVEGRLVRYDYLD